MSILSNKEKKELLKLARSIIAAELNADEKVYYPDKIPESLEQKQGCFVTLHKNNNLRGCIGNIEPSKSLISGIKENAINAAFRDPRFPPLKLDELEKIEIEISILTVPEPLDYEDYEDLKAKLKSGIHGVIISKGWKKSTFLPQVWKQLPDKEVFLSHLCLKAGMDKDCWQDKNLDVKVYEVEYFSE